MVIMNKEQLLKKFSEYDAVIDNREATEEGSMNVSFLDVSSNKIKGLKLSAQFIGNQLYCVYFLNNQFFELDDSELVDCIASILDGNYTVHANKRGMQYVTLGNGIIPERVDHSDEYREQYALLPVAW